MHDPFCEWSEPCIHGKDQKHSKDGENPSVPDASYCFRCGADCTCELIVKVRVDEHAAFYDAASPYTASINDNSFDACRVAYEKGQRDGLAAAREAIAATHQPMPVIQCACGWGVNCPECGPESNRTVGHVCRMCCDDWGDHGFCSDFHNLDDTPFHHVGDMWSGPHCPVIAALDALKGGQS
jgi:hypothetical protein